MDYRAKGEAHDGLLPCPYCGEKEHLYLCYPPLGHGDPYAIDCIGCGYDFEPRAGRDVKAAWNRRASSDSHAKLVEAAKIALEAIVLAGIETDGLLRAENHLSSALRLAGEDQS